MLNNSLYQRKPSQMETMLQQNIMNRMSQGLGQKERQNYWQNAVGQLNKQRDEGVTNTLRNMNRRGILNSTITNQGVNKIADTYSQNLTGLQRDLYNMDQQRRNQNLAMALNYLTGINMPRERMDWQSSENSLNRELQKWLSKYQADIADQAGKGSLFGDLISGVGSILAAPATGGTSILAKLFGL